MTPSDLRAVQQWRRRPEPGQPLEAGFALMMVLITMAALMLFMTVSLTAAIRNAAPSRAQQDSKAATAAAQAGIEEYLGRLANDSEYWRRGNVDLTNAAFSTAGRRIPGLTTAGAFYKYKILNSVASIDAGNPIQLQVTGFSSAENGGKVVSSVLRAQLQRTGATGAWTPQYPYFSNYEVGDPLQFTTANSKCGNYYYGTAAGSTSTTGRNSVTGNATACPEIPWFTGDSVTGQAYSNDAQYIVGNPSFSVKPKTAYPGASSKYFWGAGTPANPPQNASAISTLPANNSYLVKDVNPRPDGGTPGPGCYYKGATKITFSGTSMTVYSPLTTTTVAGCFNAANAANPQTFSTIPPVLYVAQATSGSCPALGYPAAGEFTGGAYLDSTGGTQYSPSFSCARGTAYVSGVVDGNVTVGTQDDIVIGGDLTTANTTSNMVGLNAGADVWIYHPVQQTGTSGGTTSSSVSTGSCTAGTSTSGSVTTTISCTCTSWVVVCLQYSKTTTVVTASTISYTNLLGTPVLNVTASILAGSGSLIVQNFDRGAPLSTPTTNRLTVYGSVSQKYRGPVAAIASSSYSSGYLVNYAYDPRLPAQLPPYFIDPGLSTWTQTLLTDS